MDREFQKSIFYSALFHALLFLIFFLLYRSFILVRTPLLMDLTLIGEMSQGQGMGLPAPHAGAEPGQMPPAQTAGEFDPPEGSGETPGPESRKTRSRG